MSVNPGASASAGAGASAVTTAAVEALIAAELNALAADAQALQGQVTTGQVVTAQVLPPNGLTDLINILGNRVAASLPPSLSPGDVFTAQVTGFNGPQILLQILNTVDPSQVSSEEGAAPTPVPLETAAAPLEAVVARPLLPPEVTPSIAPPPAVFVAASVRPAASSTAAAPVPGAATPPPSAQPNPAPVTVLADIEARMAAARAGSISVNVPAPAPPPASGSPPALPSGPPPAPPSATPQPAAGQANLQPPASAPPAASSAAPVPLRFSFPPPIVPSARFSEPAPAAPPAPGGAANAAPAPSSLAAYRDPVALVRALNLPNTPTNVAAAKLALDTPQRLPAALATLESALPQSDDPRVATLRTLTAWLGKMDPASPQLAAQLSAYVDNVVAGREPKLAQMLFAQLAADQAEAPPPASGAGAGAPAPGSDAPVPIPQTPALPIMALAQAAERGVALTVDLKTQLLALINSPPPGSESSEDLVPAASTALSAITAVQLNAAQAMNLTPQTIAFTLPMWLGSGYAQARVAIDRDAPEPGGGRSLDGDNFHIAFILETKHLGIVTVDLQTVGRSFALAVKTESEGSAKRFGDALGMLTDRLQTLRYRVNSAEATVAARGTAATAAAAAPVVADDGGEGDGIATDINVRA
jgi:hypothetical protein